MTTTAAPSLRGKTIAVTRSKGEAQEFIQLVEAKGGRAVPIQAIELVPAGQSAAQRFESLLKEKRHDYCAFMSAQAVRALFDLLPEAGSLLKGTGVIAVGPKTREELERRGVSARTPASGRFSSTGVIEMLAAEREPAGKKIIIPRSAEAGEYVADELARIGMEVDEVFMYAVRTASGATDEWRNFFSLVKAKKMDAIVFTSASNVRAFFEILEKAGAARPECEIISIGPFTSAELQKKGIVNYREATEHTIRGTVEAAGAALTGKSRRQTKA
jgi:uroporphyrinogen-III synthase